MPTIGLADTHMPAFTPGTMTINRDSLQDADTRCKPPAGNTPVFLNHSDLAKSNTKIRGGTGKSAEKWPAAYDVNCPYDENHASDVPSHLSDWLGTRDAYPPTRQNCQRTASSTLLTHPKTTPLIYQKATRGQAGGLIGRTGKTHKPPRHAHAPPVNSFWKSRTPTRPGG